MTNARVLVVDDSVVVRRLVADVLAEDPRIEVVGTAANGRIALAKIEQLQPDLVTLDVEMPVMNGLETLDELRPRHPLLPVVMFSTLTARNAPPQAVGSVLTASVGITLQPRDLRPWTSTGWVARLKRNSTLTTNGGRTGARSTARTTGGTAMP